MTTATQPWPERLAAGLLRLHMVLVPLVVAPNIRDAFRLPKEIAATTLGLAAALCLVVGAIAGTGRLAARRRVEPTTLALLGFALLATLTLATTNHPEHVRSSLLGLWVGVAAFAVFSHGLSSDSLRSVLSWSVPSGVVLALIGLAQAANVYQPFGFAAGMSTSREQITSLAGNPGDLAAFLLLPTLVALARVLEPTCRHRALWFLALLCLLGGAAAARTISCAGALVVGAVFLVGRRFERRRLIAATAGILAASLLLVISWSPLRQRADEKVRDLKKLEINAFLTGRLDAWRAAVSMGVAAPWSGVGHGAFRTEFADARESLMAQGVRFYQHHAFPTFANAHNEALEVFAETGVPGLLAAIASLGALFGVARRQGRQGVGRLESSFLLATAVVALFAFPLRIALTAWPVLLAAASLVAADTEG